MLTRAAGVLATQGLWDLGRTEVFALQIRNELLESWAIHARILIEFLHCERNACDNVTIDDYVTNPTLRTKCPKYPQLPELITEAKKKGDKEIAHLSIERGKRYRQTELGMNSWQYHPITQEILRVLSQVLPLIPPERIDPEARKQLMGVQLVAPNASAARIVDSDGTPIGICFAALQPSSVLGYFSPLASPTEVEGVA